MPPPPPKIRFVHVRDLSHAGGTLNEGISVLLEQATGKSAVRKRVCPNLRTIFTKQEVASMRKLTTHPNIAQLYDFMPATPGSSHMDELYIEYCRVPLRNGVELNTLYELHARYAGQHVVVPEAFVWHLLEGLLMALRFMHFGARTADEHPVPDWDAIFHNDLHAGNIFLSVEVTSRESEYPRIVVGDFGCSYTKSQLRDHGVDLDAQDGAKDIHDVVSLLQPFCQRPPAGEGAYDMGQPIDILGSPDSWRFSEELRLVTLGLRGLDDEHPGILDLLTKLIGTREKLVATGQLEFLPLLE